jgi:sugar phosphate permease
MAQISLASSLRSMETGLFNPLWGIVVDRVSPRKLMLFGVVSKVIGMYCLSKTTNIPMFYAGFLILGLGSSLTGSILPQTLIARWFKKDIGKASGLFWMGAGLGGISVPLVVALIDKFGWQNILLYGAMAFLVIGIPLSFVFRSRPQEYGLLPDGGKPAPGNTKAGLSKEFGTSVKTALKMRVFWHIAVVTLFQFSTMSTVMLYAIPYLTDAGISRTVASSVISIYTLTSLFGRMPFGTLSDYIKKSYMMAASVVLLGIGVFILFMLDGASPFWLILTFAIIYGVGISGVNSLRAPLMSEYFGTKNFGTIFGLTSIFTTTAMMVSQPLAGWIYDTRHDYSIWWISMIVFAALALISSLTMPDTKKGV